MTSLPLLKTKRSLLIVLLSILLLNTSLYSLRNSPVLAKAKFQRRGGTTGFHHEFAKKFIYFFYYTGYFPLATQNESLVFAKQAALKEAEINGEVLIMEYEEWVRFGENARIFAFLPDALLKNSPEYPSIRLFNALFFTIAMMLLFWGFWSINKIYFGILLVLLINITPFFIFEVYFHENIFGLMASAFFMVLGINISALFGKPQNTYILVLNIIISSIIIAFVSEIRNETGIVLFSLLLIYGFAKNYSIPKKIIACVVIVTIFFGVKQGIREYFKINFEKTAQFVREKGGHVYNGPRLIGHPLWHSVFCGLGDYDKRYGYVWDDFVAYRYANPILEKKYDIHLGFSNQYRTDTYTDKDSVYFRMFPELTEYNKIIKDKVLSDVTSDPAWYVKILYKRVVKTITTTIPVPYIGWIFIPLIFYLVRRKKWFYLKLILVSLPLSATSVLIYSGSNSTYNSVFVYFIIVISLVYLYKVLQQLKQNMLEV